MPFQRQAWQAYLAGQSGLIQVPTGSGKTYAAVMGPIAAMLAEGCGTGAAGSVHGPGAAPEPPDLDRAPCTPAVRQAMAETRPGPTGCVTADGTPSAVRRARRRSSTTLGPGEPEGLRLLVITPLRALSRDLALAIEEPIREMGWPLRVVIRNGDTPSHERSRQLRRPPQILVTTPESLSVLLSNAAAPELFARLQAVVLDEWHELMGSKRGVQCELGLSWLRRLRPDLRSWAISATIGNLEEAARAALGLDASEPLTAENGFGTPGSDPDRIAPSARLINARLQRDTTIRSLLPESIDGFPWGGHLGLRMYEELVAGLDPTVSTLLFTNTRNQAERWHQCLRFACPEMEDALALHHSAIDRAEREAIEARVKAGELRWVVCTSSLDLGVDFQPVERVVQIGSAKNLARLLQRAGRSAHCPGGTSQVLFMPTNALELLEVSAMRRGLQEGLVEHRRPPQLPLDVLLQHLTSLACGPGLHPEQGLETVRSCWSFRQLTDAQ
ncbi:MAG: DEAD/DEAH box helicase, partial [Cyanobium sp.]